MGLSEGTTGYKALANDVSSRVLTNDDIKTYSFDPGTFSERNASDVVNSNNYSSQAERTIQNNSSDRNPAQTNGGGTDSNVQQVEIRNGIKYPRHPGQPHKGSDFLEGHDGCFHCGGAHRFNECPRGKEDCALKYMF